MHHNALYLATDMRRCLAVVLSTCCQCTAPWYRCLLLSGPKVRLPKAQSKHSHVHGAQVGESQQRLPFAASYRALRRHQLLRRGRARRQKVGPTAPRPSSLVLRPQQLPDDGNHL